MAVRDSAPTPDEPAARQRARAETPPPHYWRRWVGDALEADAEAPADAQAVPGPAPAEVEEEPPYRVMIVEDDRSQALFAQSVLQGAGMQAEVQEPAGVIEAINRFKPDLILMDLHMPGLDGIHLTSMIREQPGLQLLPIVFLTGDTDPERQFEALEGGADDFLSKPVRPRHLIAAVSNRIQRLRAQSREAAAAAAPAGAPRNNPDTGLATRGWLLQQIDQALAAGEDGGLYFIEIASALSLREHYGYAAFERLMAEAGRRLAQIVAPAPLARLNDNSFLALARGVDKDAMAPAAAGIRTRLAMENFMVRDDERVQLRSAIGYAALSQGFTDAGSALEAIERSALQARLSSDGVAAYVPPSDHEEQERLALLEGQIELAYQPIVSVAGSDLAQYQVLMRLRQPDGALLSAGQVIPAAEASGRIADLDQQVMEHALNLVAQRAEQGAPLRLFVSQSPRTLAREAFADWMLQAIAERRIDGTSVVIDIRLADALIHAVTLAGFCQRLMPVGVQFCLGQFEPGDEADALLAQLPLGYVRMAGRFAAAHQDNALRDQLRAVIESAHRLNLQVIGQQIEDPQAAAAMWVAGIDFVQGNLVSSVGSDLDFDFQSAVL